MQHLDAGGIQDSCKSFVCNCTPGSLPGSKDGRAKDKPQDERDCEDEGDEGEGVVDRAGLRVIGRRCGGSGGQKEPSSLASGESS